MENLDPEIDMGPLSGLIGVWQGNKGKDLSPEPDGTEDNAYYEIITFSVTRRVSNAEEQKLAVVRYHQLVQRVTNDKILHDQAGYWAWDAVSNVLMHSFSIPRGIAVVAGGTLSKGSEYEWVFDVSALAGDAKWSIIESPFMQQKARTLSYHHCMKLKGDYLTYEQLSALDIYGRHFDHTDTNQLQRIK